jgi:thiol:disulfide interchange protein DsbD
LCVVFSRPLLGQDRKNPFSADWDDSIQKLKPGERYTLTVKFHVPDGYYLYQDKTDVSLTQLADLTQVKKVTPPAKTKVDPFLKKEVQIYLHDFEISLLLKVPPKMELGRRTLEGEVHYQGCSPDFCYRPMKTPLMIPIEIISEKQVLATPAAPDPQNSVTSSSIPSVTQTKSLSGVISLIREGKVEDLFQAYTFFPIFVTFLAGILTSLTPCVLPIIPLTLAVVGVEKKRKTQHNLAVSLFLVLGITITYTALGLVSASLGLRLGFLFQSPYFLGFLVLFFIFMSLAMLGVFRLELPVGVRNFLGQVGGSGYRGAFLAGLTIGFVASPCVGPLIGPLLIWVAKSQNLWWGGVLLMAYGLGMGLLFLLTGTFFSTLGSRLPGGNYTNIIKKGLAILILAPAAYYSYVLSSPWLGHRHEGWVYSLQEGLSLAKSEKKPIMIDFFAESCLPCLELDRKTFNNPQVKKALEEFVRIKIDCTFEGTICKEAVDRFGVIGWPTILFLDKDQNLYKDLSVIGGFVGPERLGELLSEVKRRG